MAENEELRRALDRYLAFQRFCNEARNLADREPGKFMNRFAKYVSGRHVGKKHKSPRDFCGELFDDLMPALYEACFVHIVSVFEKVAFDHLDNAVGPMRNTMEAGYRSGPFFMVSKRFVKQKEEIKNLGGVTQLLKGKIPQNLEKDLIWVVDYRNRLAHGKHFGEEPREPKDMQEVVEILESVLEQIAPSS